MNRIACPLRAAAMLLSLSLLPLGAASAATIYDNGVPDRIGAQDSDIDANRQSADDFSLLGGSSTITDVHWWGFYFDGTGGLTSPDPDQFAISIFETSLGGDPEDNVFVDAVFSGPVTRTLDGDIFGIPFYSYSVDVDPIALTPGTSYWLSIINDTSGFGDPSFNWLWATSDSNNGTGHQRDLPLPNNWRGIDQEFAFNLTNDNLPVGGVPLPGSLLLMLPGLLWLRRGAARQA